MPIYFRECNILEIENTINISENIDIYENELFFI
jgi:hypothetical protein